MPTTIDLRGRTLLLTGGLGVPGRVIVDRFTTTASRGRPPTARRWTKGLLVWTSSWRRRRQLVSDGLRSPS